MTSEATLIYRTEEPIPFTVDNTVAIPKGTLCLISDPMTAAISATAGEVCAGITASEKIANDGKTKLGIYRKGIFKMIASGGVTVGNALTSFAHASFQNNVGMAPVTASGATVIGTALETATTTESFLVDLNVGAGSSGVS